MLTSHQNSEHPAPVSPAPAAIELSCLPEFLERARAETISLTELVEDRDLNRLLHPDFSPLRWHLGHIAAYEARWILREAGGLDSPEPEFDHLFDPRRGSKEGRVHLPSRDQLLSYGRRVREASLRVIETAAPDHPNPLLRDGYIGWLVYEHERQHQEILTFLLQMVPLEALRTPDSWRSAIPGSEPSETLITVPSGAFRMGSDGRRFAYDNERSEHTVELDDYRIRRAPVTEYQFAAFIADGGYREESFWTSEGWRWKQERGIAGPRGWSPTEAGGWTIRTLFEIRRPMAGYPVVGVSCHEAEAFCRWEGSRLPSEAEWERAASWEAETSSVRRFPWGEDLPTPDRANTDCRSWGTRPISSSPPGTSPVGCLDLAGQVWEWTASTFAPYPGFRPFPYEGYSQAWFDGAHRVLRGGSWATAGHLCRNTFRNWYHPHVREIHAGFRTAAIA